MKTLILTSGLLIFGSAGAQAFSFCPEGQNPANYVNSWNYTPLVPVDNNYLFQFPPEKPREEAAIKPETIAALKQLTEVLKARGVRLYSVVQPSREELFARDRKLPSVQVNTDHYNAFVDQLSAAGIVVPNLLKKIIDENVSFDQFYFARDHHWNPGGSKISAGAVADLIKQDPAYAGLSRSEYTVNLVDTWHYVGSFAQDLAKSCNEQIPAEDLPVYSAVNNHSDGLLDDKPPADIAIVGTSFAARKQFAFMDFLTAFTGLETVNYAIEGADAYAPLETYVSSKDFLQSPPKFIVWEAPITYDRNDINSIRRIIGAILGDCSNPVFTGLSKSDGDLPVGAQGNVLVIDFADRTVTGAKVALSYSDSSHETISLQQSDRINTGGKYLVNLPSVPLQSLSISGTQKVAQVKVCQSTR